MPDDTSNIPPTDAVGTVTPNLPAVSKHMPIALALWFDERLSERAKTIAGYSSNAKGFVPDHLRGQPQTCFAIVELAMTWNLSPFSVARSVYPLPGGKTGFEGKLVHAILASSGKIVGEIKYEYYGDWDALKGKFVMKTGDKGKPYASNTSTRHQAHGPAINVLAHVTV